MVEDLADGEGIGDEIEAAARELLATPKPAAQPEKAEEPQSAEPTPRRETLMEID